MDKRVLRERVAGAARQHGISLDEEPSCEELKTVVLALQESLEMTPPDKKPGILKMIDRILTQMEKQGCF